MPRDIEFTKIAAHYRQLIEDGTLRPGDDMPSMKDTAKEFKVTVTTVNRAYRILKSEGLTLAKPGVGTVVASRPNVATTGAARLRRIDRVGKPYAPGETSTGHWVGLRSCSDPAIADLLEVELHDEVILRRRVFQQDGKPTTVGLSCIHVRALSDVPELLDERPFDRFWQEVYKERTGREITLSPERRSARLISNDELNALGIDLPREAAAAVLVVVNVFHDEDGPLEVWEDVYPPGTWQVDGE